MPFDNKEWSEKNKEKIKKQSQEYYQKNKEKINKNNKEWWAKNKDKTKEYEKTPARKKTNRIKRWKFRGIICDDFDALYQRYITTTNCDLCNRELTEDRYITSTTRCLDHDHETGKFRNVVCSSCNTKRG